MGIASSIAGSKRLSRPEHSVNCGKQWIASTAPSVLWEIGPGEGNSFIKHFFPLRCEDGRELPSLGFSFSTYLTWVRSYPIFRLIDEKKFRYVFIFDIFLCLQKILENREVILLLDMPMLFSSEHITYAPSHSDSCTSSLAFASPSWASSASSTAAVTGPGSFSVTESDRSMHQLRQGLTHSTASSATSNVVVVLLCI